MSQFTAITFMLSLLACGREEALSERNSISDQEGVQELEVQADPGNDSEIDPLKGEDLPRRDELNDESALPPMATTGAFLTSCYLHGQKILCALEDDGVIADEAELTYRLEIKLFAGDRHINGSHYRDKVLTHDD